jgi:hypothetical protein
VCGLLPKILHVVHSFMDSVGGSVHCRCRAIVNTKLIMNMRVGSQICTLYRTFITHVHESILGCSGVARVL